MLAALLGVAIVANSQHVDSDNDAAHGLAWDSRGKLSFTQMKSEQRRATSPLYSVSVGFDIQAMDMEKGLTMMFDKTRHVLRLDSGVDLRGVAWGRYVDDISKTGWSELYLDTTDNAEVSNDVRMYSAGYLEGLLTAVRLSEFHYNTHKLLMRTEASKHALGSLKGAFDSQIEFLKSNANLAPHVMGEEPTDPYWKQARFVLFQLWGICDGYNAVADGFGSRRLALEDLVVLNTGSEVVDMLEAYTPQAKADRADAQSLATTRASAMSFLQRSASRARTSLHNLKVRQARNRAPRQRATMDDEVDVLDDEHWEKRVAETGHCSAMVKLGVHNKDLLMGHTTWDDYSKMTRIFKYYNFHLDGAATMATRIGFSSYPGLVSSTDNFFVMSSGLAVMDTSLEILEPSVWDKVEDFPAHPHIPSFVHLMVTNRLAKNGAHWTRLLSSQNSGTSTSQWMVVDYNRFKANAAVPDDTFWVLETIPGLTHAADMSFHLREFGFWPSFNRPYFDNIRKASGFEVAQKTRGSLYSWLNNPRARIFASMQGATNGLMEMRHVMSHNTFPSTGVQPIEPGHEISARMDLSTSMPIPNGGIDAKVINRCLFRKMQVQTISSPAHSSLPPFQWVREDGSENFPGYPHDGLPNRWSFDWIQQTPMKSTAVFDWTDC
jgi:hypothetical protein